MITDLCSLVRQRCNLELESAAEALSSSTWLLPLPSSTSQHLTRASFHFNQMSSSPEPGSIYDITGCPRFTFTWPGLALSSCSASAQAFLPIFKSDSFGVTASIEDGGRTLLFQDIFRPAQDRVADEAWVKWLVSESAQAEFGASVTVQPLRFRNPCTVSVFLQPAADEDQTQPEALHVLLLSPVRDIEPHSVRLSTPARRLSSDMVDPMSADEAYDMLDHVNRAVHGLNCDNWGPPDEPLRTLLQGLPEIAFIGSTTGEVLWFSDRWYEYVSDSQMTSKPGQLSGCRLNPAHQFCSAAHHADWFVSTFRPCNVARSRHAPAFCALTRLSLTVVCHRERGQSVDRTAWEAIFHADDIGTALAVWTHSMSTTTEFQFEYRIRRRDGVMRWFVCKGRPCRNERGQLTQWACTV